MNSTKATKPAKADKAKAKSKETHINSNNKSDHAASRRHIITTLVFAILTILLVYSHAETYMLRVVYYEFASPQVPMEFEGTTIALITDIHHGWSFSQERVRKIVEQVNALHPDLIALGGDYILYDTTTKYADSCFLELAKLEAPLGCFAVLGNHDYEDWEKKDNPHQPYVYNPFLRDPKYMKDVISKSGIELLDNHGVWINKNGARFRLGGVGDYKEGLPSLAATLHGTKSSDLVILLSHHPDFAQKISPQTVDLMLSGHTHGGQLTFFGLWAPYTSSDSRQKYRSGVNQDDDVTVIVSNGIGTSSFLALRFFARPQIVMITLQHM